MNRSTLQITSGALMIIPILFSKSLTGTFIQAVCLIVLAVLSGRKFRPLPNIILLLSVSLAHTLQPSGLQLFTIGSFPVTLGSLSIGAKKALLLISFMYVSHYMMKYRPRIPGKLGRLISMQFFYYDRLTTNWHSIEQKRPLIPAIDTLMIEASQNNHEIHLKEKMDERANLNDIVIHIVHVALMYIIFAIFSHWFAHIVPVMELLP